MDLESEINDDDDDDERKPVGTRKCASIIHVESSTYYRRSIKKFEKR